MIMPSKSKKQAALMAAAANNREFARRAGIPQKVAKEFHFADKKRRGSKSTWQTKKTKKKG
jgi:hypothetical protein